MNINEEWASRQERDDETRRTHERERLILWTTESIAELMASSELSKADVARKLGTSRANVTQFLSGGRNATLSSIADLAWACGQRAIVKFEPLRSGQFISSPVQRVGNTQPKVVSIDTSPKRKFGGNHGVEFINVAMGEV